MAYQFTNNVIPARYADELKKAAGIRNTPNSGSQKRKANKLGTAWPCFSIPKLFDYNVHFAKLV